MFFSESLTGDSPEKQRKGYTHMENDNPNPNIGPEFNEGYVDPSPRPTTEDLTKGKEGNQEFPKNSDGSPALEKMDADTKAAYYKEQYDNSTRGFQKFKTDKEREIETLRQSTSFEDLSKSDLQNKAQQAENLSDFKDLVPNYDQYSPEDQDSLKVFYNNMRQSIRGEFEKDPAIRYARESYNERKFDQAFDRIADKYPDIKNSREEFKRANFKPNNVPDNIENILDTLAKSHLYEKSRDIGAEEERKRQTRVNLEPPTGGEKTPKVGMTSDDWEHLAQTNPQEFARRGQEYDEQFRSGKLK